MVLLVIFSRVYVFVDRTHTRILFAVFTNNTYFIYTFKLLLFSMLSTRIPFSLGISLWSKWPFRGLKHLNNAVFASVISDTGKFNQRRQLISKAAVNSQDFQFKTVFSNENVSLCLRQSKRGMAKGKDRKKEKKSDKPKVILDDEDMEKVIAFEDFKLEVQSIIDELKNDLKLNYNVRLNPRQIET